MIYFIVKSTKSCICVNMQLDDSNSPISVYYIDRIHYSMTLLMTSYLLLNTIWTWLDAHAHIRNNTEILARVYIKMLIAYWKYIRFIVMYISDKALDDHQLLFKTWNFGHQIIIIKIIVVLFLCYKQSLSLWIKGPYISNTESSMPFYILNQNVTDRIYDTNLRDNLSLA